MVSLSLKRGGGSGDSVQLNVTSDDQIHLIEEFKYGLHGLNDYLRVSIINNEITDNFMVFQILSSHLLKLVSHR